MTCWMITYDRKQFDINGCLANIGSTDWPQLKNKFAVGDIVYMYCSAPEMRITHKLRISEINVPQERHISEAKFLTNLFPGGASAPYIRLVPISESKSYKLRREYLLRNGMNQYAGRGRQKVSGQLLDYIESAFNN